MLGRERDSVELLPINNFPKAGFSHGHQDGNLEGHTISIMLNYARLNPLHLNEHTK